MEVLPRHKTSLSKDSLLQAFLLKLDNKTLRHIPSKGEQSTKSAINGDSTAQELEQYLTEWEQQLTQQQKNLDLQRAELKKYSKQLEIQSKNILRDKVELNGKLKEYCHVLEQINEKNLIHKGTHSVMISQENKLASSTKSKSSSYQAIDSCQNRIANLLQSIQQTSKSQTKLRQSQHKSYLKPQNKQDIDIEECLFGQQKSYQVKSFHHTVQKDVQKEYHHSVTHHNPKTRDFTTEVKNPEIKVHITTESEKELHELKLNSIQMNEQLFYRKIQMEVDKLKDLKKKML